MTAPNSEPDRSPGPHAKSENLFVGPDGLRAGWRVAIFAILYLVFEGFLVGIGFKLSGLSSRSLRGVMSSGRTLLVDGGSFAAAVIAAALMSRGERRSMAGYGLPLARAFGRRFWTGALWGVVALSALLVALRLNGNFYFGGLAMHGSSLAGAAAEWAAAFLVVAFAEEYSFRGYALTTLARGAGFWPAAIILSIVFGGLHLGNPGEAWLGGLSAGLIGLFFCFTVRRTGTLWFAVGFHWLWDYAETFLYSVPDSGLVPRHHLAGSSFHGSRWLTGGSVGPEGSLLVFPLIAILFWLFARAYPRIAYPVATDAATPVKA